jgi:hypothetical protein
MQANMPTPAGPEYGIRRNGNIFAMTCLSLKDAEEMANILRKEGERIEIFLMATGQAVADESRLPDAPNPAH